MLFSYSIAGRTPGVVKQTEYVGLIEATTPKEAIVKALAAEFGSRDKTDPIAALTDTGWIYKDLLLSQLDLLDDQEQAFDLQAEEHSYVVEVVIDKQPR